MVETHGLVTRTVARRADVRHNAAETKVWCFGLLLVATVAACDGCEINEGTTPIAPALRIESVELGSVYRGFPINFSLELENPGRAAVRLDDIRFSEPEFSVLVPFPLAVDPGETVRLQVLFLASTSTPLGAFTSRVAIDSDLGVGANATVGDIRATVFDVPSCDDDNPCTDDAFDVAQGLPGCTHTPIENGPCDDGNACTINTVCVFGRCVGEPLNCDDGIDCSIDACDPVSGCTHDADHGACDDGDACSTDRCTESGCDNSTAPDYTHCGRFECTGASLCLGGICTFFADLEGFPCDDGDACTQGEVCADGECGTAVEPDAYRFAFLTETSRAASVGGVRELVQGPDGDVFANVDTTHTRRSKGLRLRGDGRFESAGPTVGAFLTDRFFSIGDGTYGMISSSQFAGNARLNVFTGASLQVAVLETTLGDLPRPLNDVASVAFHAGVAAYCGAEHDSGGFIQPAQLVRIDLSDPTTPVMMPPIPLDDDPCADFRMRVWSHASGPLLAIHQEQVEGAINSESFLRLLWFDDTGHRVVDLPGEWTDLKLGSPRTIVGANDGSIKSVFVGVDGFPNVNWLGNVSDDFAVLAVGDGVVFTLAYNYNSIFSGAVIIRNDLSETGPAVQNILRHDYHPDGTGRRVEDGLVVRNPDSGIQSVVGVLHADDTTSLEPRLVAFDAFTGDDRAVLRQEQLWTLRRDGNGVLALGARGASRFEDTSDLGVTALRHDSFGASSSPIFGEAGSLIDSPNGPAGTISYAPPVSGSCGPSGFFGYCWSEDTKDIAVGRTRYTFTADYLERISILEPPAQLTSAFTAERCLGIGSAHLNESQGTSRPTEELLLVSRCGSGPSVLEIQSSFAPAPGQRVRLRKSISHDDNSATVHFQLFDAGDDAVAVYGSSIGERIVRYVFSDGQPANQAGVIDLPAESDSVINVQAIDTQTHWVVLVSYLQGALDLFVREHGQSDQHASSLEPLTYTYPVRLLHVENDLIFISAVDTFVTSDGEPYANFGVRVYSFPSADSSGSPSFNEVRRFETSSLWLDLIDVDNDAFIGVDADGIFRVEPECAMVSP